MSDQKQQRRKDSFEIGRQWAGVGSQFCSLLVIVSLVIALFVGPGALLATAALMGLFFTLVMLAVQLEILMELRRQRE